MGAYHTIDLELNRKFTLIKEEWDSIDLGRIEMATDPAQVLLIIYFILFIYKSTGKHPFGKYNEYNRYIII